MVKVIEANLDFGTLEKRRKTDLIVLHHSASTKATPEQIHQWHLNNGWAGIGYHYVVTKDGNIHRGRPQWAVGSHCKGSNSISIGICFEGNFENEAMGKEQLKAGIELVRYLQKLFDINKVVGHKQVATKDIPTACPGRNFPLQKFKL